MVTIVRHHFVRPKRVQAQTKWVLIRFSGACLAETLIRGLILITGRIHGRGNQRSISLTPGKTWEFLSPTGQEPGQSPHRDAGIPVDAGRQGDLVPTLPGRRVAA